MKLSDRRAVDDTGLAISRAVYSKDGTRIIGGGGNLNEAGTIVVWNTSTLERLAIHRLRDSNASTIHVLDDQLLIACAYFCDSFEIWDVLLGHLVRRVEFLPKPRRRMPSGVVVDVTHVAGIASIDNGRTVILGCWDCSVKILAIESGELSELRTPDWANIETVFVREECSEVVGCTQCHVYTWNYKNRTPQRVFSLDDKHVWQSIYLQRDDLLCSLSRSGQISVLHLSDWIAEQHKVRLKQSPVSLGYSRRSNIIAVGHNDGMITFIDPVEWKIVSRMAVSESPLCSIDFAPDRDALCAVVAAENNRVIEFEYSVY